MVEWLLSASIPELLWKVSIQAAVVAVVIWLVSRAARKAPARIRHALWALVVLKFLIPPFAQLPAELGFLHYGDRTAARATTAISAPQGTANGTPAVVADPLSRPAEPDQSPLRPDLVGLIWVVGVGVMASGLLFRQARQELLIRTSRPAGTALLDIFRKCAEKARVVPVPRLRISAGVPTPLLVGLFRPMVILPCLAAEPENASHLEAMLLHELAHIRRRDMASLWLYQLAKTLFFFHPALWLAGYEMSKEKELACDELVISATWVSPKDYAAGYVEALKMSNAAISMPVCLAMAEPYQVEKTRVERILRGPAPRLGAGWIAVFAVAAVVALPTFAGIANTDDPAASRLVTVQGPGLIVTLSDNRDAGPGNTVRLVQDADIGDTVKELFAAGAEAVSVDGQRCTRTTEIRCAGPTITANEVMLVPPYEIKAVGDPKTLEKALRAKGGIVERLGLRMIAIQPSQRVVVEPFAVAAIDEKTGPRGPSPSGDAMYTPDQIRATSAETFLERMLYAEPGYWKFAALNALAQKAKDSRGKARRSILSLVTGAMHDKSRPVYQRWQCCYVLRDCGDARAVPDLIKILLHDENEVIRSVAAEAVAGFSRSAEAHEALLQADRQETSPRVREVLDRHLGQEARERKGK